MVCWECYETHSIYDCLGRTRSDTFSDPPWLTGRTAKYDPWHRVYGVSM